jgi:phosphoenolpyruvate-protein phosphotransferase (PTS system enzyme I)
MAGEPLFLPILLGFELDSLSMNPQAVPRVKNLIRRSSMRESRRLVERVLQLGTALEIHRLLRRTLLKNFPEEFRVFDPNSFAADDRLPV